MSLLFSHENKNLEEISKVFTKKHLLLPYFMHYWYFNLINLDEDYAYSVILSKNKIKTSINNSNPTLLDKKKYSVWICDFKNDKLYSSMEDIQIDKKSISTKNFEFKISNSGVSASVLDKEYHSEKILSDTYIANYFYLWGLSNINSRNENSFLHCQNVIKRGPLFPWKWLHFYFEDGQYAKIFNPILNKRFRLNDDYFNLDSIIEKEDTIAFKCNKNSDFLVLTLDKNKPLTIRYKPRFSPTWNYEQYSPTLKSIDTNIPALNGIKYGRGLLEIARGFCL